MVGQRSSRGTPNKHPPPALVAVATEVEDEFLLLLLFGVDPCETLRKTFCSLIEDLTFFSLVLWEPTSKLVFWPTRLKIQIIIFC